MRAVQGVDGAAAVVDVEEPPGSGELLEMRSASICSSDLMYLRFGTTRIIGHELAGVREDGTPVVVEAPVVPDVARWQYAKLLANLGNALEAVAGSAAGDKAGALYQVTRVELFVPAPGSMVMTMWNSVPAV